MATRSPERDDLLPRIAGGEPDAVGACLERYTPLVWSLARKFWKDVGTLEDVVQDIFIEIWKSAGRFDASKASEATFVAVIARRRMIDRRRQASRGPEVERVEESTVAREDPGFEEVDLSDEAARARAVLDQLSPDQRRVILMSVVEGLTHPEIASSTGMPLGTVKSHIRRGLDKAARLVQSPREEADT